MNAADVRARLADGPFVQLGDRTDAILAHYRRVWPDLSPGALMVRVETAGSWRYLSNRLADANASARAAPTWVHVLTFPGGTTGAIARAACRESVWRYGSDWGAAAVLQKK